MSIRAADDFAQIRRNRIRLTRICYRKLDLPITECWCMKAGPNGENIPCSEARDPTPWERVELGKPSVQGSEFVDAAAAGIVLLPLPRFRPATADEFEDLAHLKHLKLPQSKQNK